MFDRKWYSDEPDRTVLPLIEDIYYCEAKERSEEDNLFYAMTLPDYNMR